MLEARRREKDYPLRYQTLGFEDARTKYVTKVQQQVELIRQNMAEIKRLATHPEDIALTEAVSQAVTEYETTFLATVDLLEQRGHVDTGVQLTGQAGKTIQQLAGSIDKSASAAQ